MFVVMLFFFSSLVALTSGETVCYEPFGCFSDEPPFHHYLMTNPKHPRYVMTSFTLHTPYRKRTFKDFSSLTIAQAARILTNKNLKLIIHGLLESADKTWVRKLTKGLLDKQNTDVIVVDYGEGATGLMAAGNARLVGAQLAYLLRHIFKLKKRNGKEVHIIGFSAGAHVAGYTGKRLIHNGYKLGRITGLDPGDLPYGLRIYENAHSSVRLDRMDADFVDVIHSDTNGLGIDRTIGHLDFYPNGGAKQPGCDAVSTIRALGAARSRESFFHAIGCNHIRAVDLFVESLLQSSCNFTAYPCDNFQTLQDATCPLTCGGGRCPVMGYEAVAVANVTNFVGKKLFLQTRAEPPFCRMQKEPKKYQNPIFSNFLAKLKSFSFW